MSSRNSCWECSNSKKRLRTIRINPTKRRMLLTWSKMTSREIPRNSIKIMKKKTRKRKKVILMRKFLKWKIKLTINYGMSKCLKILRKTKMKKTKVSK